jgi:flagellar biosynthesis protein FlhG
MSESDGMRGRGAAPGIWAVGGGKGGVGKSVVTANLGVALARRGLRCVLVDADLGGANLHTLLGGHGRGPTLSDFLNGRVGSLAEVVQDTRIANLRLVSGARALLAIANPKHFQKQKLLRQLRRLDADVVLLDLAAGSTFNVLDFFLAADRGLLVTAPEPTAIENTYHFLKAAFYRSLQAAARSESVRPTLERVIDERTARGVRTPRELLEAVEMSDAEAGRALREAAARFAPLLVVNQVRTLEQRTLGRDVSAACRDYLDTRVDFLGALERDECVRDAVRRREPVLTLFPGCPFARDLEAVAGRLRVDGRWSAPARPGPLAPPRARAGETPLAASGLEAREWRAPADVPPAYVALDLAQPGSSLRRRREQLGLGLEELVERTRIKALAHIEEERFDRLPPEPYLRGFVVQYARALGIRGADAVAASYVERFRRSGAGRQAG